jgi:hypothetical protein
VNTLEDWSVIALEDWALIRRLARNSAPPGEVPLSDGHVEQA